MLLEGKGLTMVYDRGKELETYALRDVNIALDINQMIGVMGPSGSGKSSLLYVLSGLKKPTAGTVVYKGMDLDAMSAVERARLRKKEFGFIFQRHFLIDYMTALDNVLVGINDASAAGKNKALLLMDRLGIKHVAYKKPFQLSGGQRQRIAIARALINDPAVIFADEPTASLDHANAQEVMAVLEEIKAKTSVLVVTHDASILKNADSVIELWDGRIKADQPEKPVVALSKERHRASAGSE